MRGILKERKRNRTAYNISLEADRSSVVLVNILVKGLVNCPAYYSGKTLCKDFATTAAELRKPDILWSVRNLEARLVADINCTRFTFAMMACTYFLSLTFEDLYHKNNRVRVENNNIVGQEILNSEQ